MDDLLSLLSDDILVSILSYLPIKYAIVTIVLSRRWRHLWCQTVRLDFDDMERWNKLLSQDHLGLRKHIDLDYVKRTKYINWVYRIIRQHNSPTIDQFKICFSLDMVSKGTIDKWIEFAISKNVKRLALDLVGGFATRKSMLYLTKSLTKFRSGLKLPLWR